MAKEKYNYRLDPEIVEAVKKYNINISRLIEETLRDIVKIEKCPTCGQEIKKIRRRKK